jgi:hypothetical protein
MILLCAIFSFVSASNIVAFVAERNLTVDLLDSLLNARDHLPLEMPIILMTQRRNWKFFEQPYWRKLNLVLEKRFETPKSAREYSRLLQSCTLLDTFANVSFILVFQADNRFCSTSPYNVTGFAALNYAYIGAPWQHPVVAGSRVGNGGFSLRRVEHARACCMRKPPANPVLYHPEDLAVIRCMVGKKFPMAPVDVAEKFSSESYLPESATVAPMAIHKAHHANHSPTNLKKLTDLCPEMRTLALVRPEW